MGLEAIRFFGCQPNEKRRTTSSQLATRGPLDLADCVRERHDKELHVTTSIAVAPARAQILRPQLNPSFEETAEATCSAKAASSLSARSSRNAPSCQRPTSYRPMGIAATTAGSSRLPHSRRKPMRGFSPATNCPRGRFTLAIWVAAIWPSHGLTGGACRQPFGPWGRHRSWRRTDPAAADGGSRDVAAHLYAREDRLHCLHWRNRLAADCSGRSQPVRSAMSVIDS
jgi:hypothetical protein